MILITAHRHSCKHSIFVTRRNLKERDTCVSQKSCLIQPIQWWLHNSWSVSNCVCRMHLSNGPWALRLRLNFTHRYQALCLWAPQRCWFEAGTLLTRLPPDCTAPHTSVWSALCYRPRTHHPVEDTHTHTHTHTQRHTHMHIRYQKHKHDI